MKYLADTNVLSEVRRTGGSPIVRERFGAIDPRDLRISSVTIGEVVMGIWRLAPGAKRRELQNWIDQVEADFVGRILLVDAIVARRWGEITAQMASRGRTLHAPDGLIAATALVHGLTLLPRNTADFADTGVSVLDPWTTAIA